MSETHGTFSIVRLVVARDRLRLLAWTAGIALLVWTTAASTKGIYPTQADLDKAAALAIDNPAALAFNGPAQALNTIGGQIAFQIGAFGFLLIGLMSLLMVGRVTRGEEDSGRLEVVRSMPVGRQAPLAAGLLVVTGLNAVVAIIVAITLLLEGLAVHGSLVFGASYFAFGLAFLGVAAVAAQVAENPRVVAGSAGAILGLAFAVRAVGDAESPAVSWLSPMGWAQKARPYAGERWWPLLLLLVVGAGLVWAAVALSDRRDFGAGLVAARPGPNRAPPSLRTSLGLAIRLHRAAVFWWGIGVLTLGLVYGSLADSIDQFVSDNQALKDVLASNGHASITDSYLATSLLTVALLAAGPALQVAARLRSEEADLRAEAILATPTSRQAWMRSHLVAAACGAVLALVVGGLGVGVAYALTGGGVHQIPRLLVGALVYLPAVLLLVGSAAAIFGLAPRWTPLAWVLLGACFVIAMFGPLLDLPTWLVNLSPFQHIPAVPADPLRVVPIVVLLVCAAGFVALGLSLFRRRDLVSS